MRASCGDRWPEDRGEQVPIIGALCVLVMMASGERSGEAVSISSSASASSASAYLTRFLARLLTGVDGGPAAVSRPYLLATWLGAWHRLMSVNNETYGQMEFGE